MDRLKHNRAASLTLLALIYLLAGAVGVAIYRHLSYPLWGNLLLADAAATVVVFAFSVLLGNASVYDPYWSVQPMVILCGYMITGKPTGYSVLLFLAVCFWGVRLTANWAYTFGDLTHQDWRYTMLRETTGALYPIVNFGGIHMVPTLIVYLCTLPAVYVTERGVPGNLPARLLLLVCVGSALLQGTADVQMHKFRRAHTGTFIRTGLWKYSRHPNYLGEILMWWGVALSAVCALGGSFRLLLGAAANTALFLIVSIPMADRRQAKKPGYDAYRAATRMLLPIKKS